MVIYSKDDKGPDKEMGELTEIHLEVPELPKDTYQVPKLRFMVKNVLGTANVIYEKDQNPTCGPSFKLKRVSGYKPALKIDVEPFDENIPIETILFQGKDSPLKAGDTIDALIPLIKKNRSYDPEYDYDEDKIYTELKYKFKKKYSKTENAIEISILNKKGNSVRTDRNSDYKEFTKLKINNIKS